MAERLFGLETEYAFSALDPQGKSVDRSASISRILGLARKRLAHLPRMSSSGIFLENGARFYVDCGQPALTDADLVEEWRNSVDLIMEDNLILVRPDPDNMEIAFRADELLQDLVSKCRIQFLNASNENVRRAIKRRGEYWRTNPLPRSRDEMKQMIVTSRIGIGGKAFYYYIKTTGTRFLTYQESTGLAGMDEASLRRHLSEIQNGIAQENRLHNPEVAFFMAGPSFSFSEFAAHDFISMSAAALRAAHEALAGRFRDATAPEFRQDDLDDLEWRNHMFTALVAKPHEALAEEMHLGLSPEFFMQIEWLAGGRIEEGELNFDPLLDECARDLQDETLARVCDQKVRGFIFNFIREHGDLEYVNIGRVIGSLSARPAFRGRRGVYIAALKPRGAKRRSSRSSGYRSGACTSIWTRGRASSTR